MKILPTRILLTAVLIFTSMAAYAQHDGNWNDNYIRYLQFLEENGRKPTDITFDKEEEALAIWYTKQLKAYRNNAISDEHIRKLEQIPDHFWVTRFNEWGDNFRAYRDYKENNGLDPSKSPEDGPDAKIARWLEEQRRAYQEGKLTETQIKLLETVPWHMWDLRSYDWDARFAEYSDFMARNQRQPEFNAEDKAEKRIARWLNLQRKIYYTYSMSDGRINRMEGVAGHSWTLASDDAPVSPASDKDQADLNTPGQKKGGKEISEWLMMYIKVREFQSTYNRDPFMTSRNPEEAELGKWFNDQKQNEGLSDTKKEMIGKVAGTKTGYMDHDWFENYEKYKRFLDLKGVKPYIASSKPEEAELAEWHNLQVKSYMRHNLIDEKKYLLESLSRHSWQMIIDNKQYFSDRIGRPPLELEERELRQKRKKETRISVPEDLNSLPAKLIKAQNADRSSRPDIMDAILGKMAGTIDEQWKDVFLRYYDYKMEHHGNDPLRTSSSREVRETAYWLQDQRIKFKHGKLLPHEVMLLESSAGHVWFDNQKDWYSKLAEYDYYKSTNGGKDPDRDQYHLYVWLMGLRRSFWGGRLSVWQVYLVDRVQGHAWDNNQVNMYSGNQVKENMAVTASYWSWADVKNDLDNFVEYFQNGSPSDPWFEKKSKLFIKGQMPAEEIDRFNRFIVNNQFVPVERIETELFKQPEADGQTGTGADASTVNGVNSQAELDVDKVLYQKISGLEDMEEADTRSRLEAFIGLRIKSDNYLAFLAMNKILLQVEKNDGFFPEETIAFMAREGNLEFIAQHSEYNVSRIFAKMKDIVGIKDGMYRVDYYRDPRFSELRLEMKNIKGMLK